MTHANPSALSRRTFMQGTVPAALGGSAFAGIAIAAPQADASALAPSSSVRALFARYLAARNALEIKAAEAEYTDEQMSPWVDAYVAAMDAVFGGLVMAREDLCAALEFMMHYNANYEWREGCDRLLNETVRFLRYA